ncbi:hypothetical protein [Dokdonia sp. R86516]|uniref:hypothetical protein n=1 Tax=Dokdonia sp. R86516 TaxID=3093856 RepID=UPI0037C7687B
MKKVDFDIIPLSISIILLVISFVVIATTNYTLTLEHYIGLSAVIISTYLYFKKRMMYYVVFGLVLLIGALGFLNFFYTAFKIGIGSFGINPIMIALWILHTAIVYQIFEKLDANK